MLAKNVQSPLGIRQPALSLTTIADKSAPTVLNVSPCRSEHAHGGANYTGGCQAASVIVDVHREHARSCRGPGYLRLPLKNCFNRSLLGLPSTSSGAPSSSTSPWCRNSTWFDTLRAKLISWVTMIMVRPSSARP